MNIQPPIFATARALSRRAGVHNTVVTRLAARGLLPPDAFVQFGQDNDLQPLFRPERAVEVLRHARATPARD